MSALPLLAATALAAAFAPPAGPPGKAMPPAAYGAFAEVRGGTHRLPGEGDDVAAVVLLFVGHRCPVSNGYAPELTRLHEEFGPKRVAFCAVYATADLSREVARTHAGEYGLRFPAVLDPEMTLARGVGATVMPEAAVLSPAGAVLYRGRIDDQYTGFGKKRPRARVRDLRAALDAVLAGRPVPTARTEAVGCYIDFPDPAPGS